MELVLDRGEELPSINLDNIVDVSRITNTTITAGGNDSSVIGDNNNNPDILYTKIFVVRRQMYTLFRRKGNRIFNELRLRQTNVVYGLCL